MFIIISYDIKDDKRRNKVCNLLKNYGSRVQYSVFECNIDEKSYKNILKRILLYINNDEDSLRIYFLCKECKNKVVFYGIGKIQDDDIFIF